MGQIITTEDARSIHKNCSFLFHIKEQAEKSKTFCILPWISLHVLPNAKALPCCHAPVDDDFGHVGDEGVEKIWNGKKYRKLRLNMLQGKSCSTCNYCYSLENSGTKSMRLKMNERFSKEFSIVEETHPDGSFFPPTLKYLDIRFSNKCNFKCRGCSPLLSSAWYEDYEKLYHRKPDDKKIINCTNTGKGRLWQELAALIVQAQEVYFAGGEPLIIDEHYMALESLIEHGRRDVAISYSTNLGLIQYKDYDLIGLWKQFRDVRVNVSVDDIKMRGEYYRKGLDWRQLLNNLEIVKENAPHVDLKIFTTVHATNVYYLPELYNFFLERGLIDTDGIEFSILLVPEEYSIQILPLAFKKQVVKKLINSICTLKKSWAKKDFGPYANQVHQIISFLFQQDRSGLLPSFARRTQALDTIRQESFAKAYPELSFLLHTKDL